MKPDGEFATIHAECGEIIAILEKVISYARRCKAKEEHEVVSAAKCKPLLE